MKKYLLLALSLAFLFTAFMAFQKSRPMEKNAPIYQEIKRYSPCYIDKRFGGLQIMSKTDENFKEKPSNMEVFHLLDFLEQQWGKEHLKLVENQLIVSDEKNATVATIPIINQEDRDFLYKFYGI